jgi:hypothetical protein
MGQLSKWIPEENQKIYFTPGYARADLKVAAQRSRLQNGDF